MLSRLRRTPGDAGFTLAELTVVLALLSIVGVIAIQGLLSAYRTTTYVQTEVDASTELQQTVERIAREIRFADPVEAAVSASNQLQLKVIREGVCSRHYYRVVSGQLVQYTQTPLLPAPAAIGSPTLPDRCVTAATAVSALPVTVHVAALSTGTVFRYFDTAGAELVFPSAGATIDRIAQVQITLRRRAGNGRIVTVSTRVDVRNKLEAPL